MSKQGSKRDDDNLLVRTENTQASKL